MYRETGKGGFRVALEPAHARISREQQTQFGLRKLALPDQNDWSSLQIEEDRQKPHLKLRFPIYGVD